MIPIEKVSRPVFQVRYGGRTHHYTRRATCLKWLARMIVNDLVKDAPSDYVEDEVYEIIYGKLIETQSIEETQAWVRAQVEASAFCELVHSADLEW
jgi:hypothetical protein